MNYQIGDRVLLKGGEFIRTGVVTGSEICELSGDRIYAVRDATGITWGAFKSEMAHVHELGSEAEAFAGAIP